MYAPAVQAEPTRAVVRPSRAARKPAVRQEYASPESALRRALGNRAYGQLVQAGLRAGAPGAVPAMAPAVERRLAGLSGGAAVLQRAPESPDDGDGGREGGEKPAKEKEKGWTRKHTDGPRLLDGRKVSYQVMFDHILPAVPKGATQVWQVVEVDKTLLTESCSTETEKTHIIDIVNIGDRTRVNDDWNWLRRDDPCFAREASRAVIGFDDRKSDYAEQTSVEVTESLAKEVLGKMAAPKGVYEGSYSFVKAANCPDCAEKLKKLQETFRAPNGEALSVSGVGSWTS